MTDIDSLAERVEAAEDAKDAAWQEYLTAYDAEQDAAAPCTHDECDCHNTDPDAAARTDEARAAYDQAAAALVRVDAEYRAAMGGGA